MYENAAMVAGGDFNDHNNPRLVSARRLGITIELVDMLTDAVHINQENAQSFPDMKYFTEPLDLLIAARDERLDQARTKVDEAAVAQKDIESGLQEAKNSGDLEKIISLTDQLEDAKSLVQCLRDMLADEEKKNALSAGDTLAAWEKVCKVYGYEWRNRLQAVLLSAQLYHENLQQLNDLNNNLWAAVARSKGSEWLDEECLLLLQGWARDGLSDEQIAENMGISVRTLYRWKNEYCQICHALKKGKDVADREIENALFKRAKGYDYEETREESKDGKIVKRIVTTKHVPGDTTAQIFWLKNRKPEYWGNGYGFTDTETEVSFYLPNNGRDAGDGEK